MKIQTAQFFETLSSGHQLTIDELEDLIKQKIKEDQFLEFKSGLEVEDGNKDASKTIRDYMCGFANSDGGILIIGVDAPSGTPVSIDGCNNHKKGDLAEWASRCLTDIASYFSPIPKFQVLRHPNGDVLIGIAQRSLNLVPQIENKQLIYNLRIHDQTLRAPEYLMADLLLGRKQRPDFDVVDCFAFNFGRITDSEYLTMDLRFELRLKCESRNIVWAEESRWGIIAWTQTREAMYAGSINQPSNHLLSFVDAQEMPDANQIRPGSLLHFNNNLDISKPFDSGNIISSFIVPIRFGDQWFSYSWMAALYLVAKNGQPLWFQISLKINNDSIKWVDEKTKISLSENSDILSVTKFSSERPIVAWKIN